MAESLYIKVDEVGELLGISRAKAYGEAPVVSEKEIGQLLQYVNILFPAKP